MEGVGVKLSLTDPNGVITEVSTSTDETGAYSGEYTPGIEGSWNVIASWTDSSIQYPIRVKFSLLKQIKVGEYLDTHWGL